LTDSWFEKERQDHQQRWYRMQIRLKVNQSWLTANDLIAGL